MIIHGNCLDVIKGLEEESIDAIVTDPPYELGFMGKKWDSTGIAYNIELWSECLRVLKPGGHLLAFSGTRTYHRMACAIEDAGFEIRDSLVWIYSSGFPKSLNIGKAYDKAHGNEREDMGDGQYADRRPRPTAETNIEGAKYGFGSGHKLTKGNSRWEGFGTALKPANEPICMARKPLSEKTILKNVLKHGAGALDIDGCRIPIKDQIGRFPANVLCTDDALNDGVIIKSTGGNESKFKPENRNTYSKEFLDAQIKDGRYGLGFGDTGSKSRYFDIDVWGEKHGILQFPKASKSDRGSGNIHPTVKPIQLMAWLVRLISKDGDTVLDPFAGSGTTGVACSKLGRKFVLIEQSEEYIEIIKNRISDGGTLF